MPKLYSSSAIIRVLEREGFVFISQRGSHAKYRKGEHTVIVPAGRREMPMGTFISIVRQSGLDRTDFDQRK